MKIIITISLISVFIVQITAAQTFIKRKQMPEKTRILFLLDCSGSMNENWEGEKRIDVAKRILTQVVEQYRYHPKLEMGLRVYGHQYDRKLKNCQDTKLEVPFGSNNHELLKNKLKALVPKGYTPIALSLEKATTDFPDIDNIRNVIILITDGIESCGKDPCTISLALQKKHIFLRPFVVGMGISLEYLKNFECMGQFYNAKNPDDFSYIMRDIMLQTLGKTTVSVELLDKNSAPREKDINMTFINEITNDAVYDYVHYRNEKGITDTLEIDAILSYDLIVNSIPPVIEKNIILKGGRHNVIKVKVPQGTLRVEQKTGDYYGGANRVLVRYNNTILNTQAVNTNVKYIAGTYKVEVLTLPPVYFESVKIEADQTTTLSLESPGFLNIANSYNGFGSLYKIEEQGQVWVYNFERTKMNLALQPGKYKLVFRSEDAKGSEYTVVKYFTISSASTTKIDLTN